MKENEVERIYRLANLEVSKEDLSLLAGKYNKVTDFIERIFEVDTSNVVSTEIIASHKAVFREDKEEKSLDREVALENAKDTEYGYFRLDWKL